MTETFLTVDPGAAVPEIARPAADRVVSGDPVFTTWNVTEDDGLFCGRWRCTPGAWRVSYDEWEFCTIREGVSVLTGADGIARTVRAGDSFVLRPGFAGTWEVLETTVKDYVVSL